MLGIDELLAKLYNTVVHHDNFATIANTVEGFFESLGIFSAVILLLFAFAELIYGKRILDYQIPVVFAIAGFCTGITVLSSLLADTGIRVIPIVVGIVVAVVAAALSRVLFYASYVLGVAYSTYTYFGEELLSGVVKGNVIIGILIAVLAVALVVIYKEWVTLFATVALGAYCAVVAVESAWDMLVGGEIGTVVSLIIFVTLVALGGAYQLKSHINELKTIFTLKSYKERVRRRKRNKRSGNFFLSSGFISTYSGRIKARQKKIKARRAARKKKRRARK